jgi:dienelactone hydrolase
MPAAAGVKSSVDEYRSGDVVVTLECFAPTSRGKHPAVVMLHGSGGLEQATGAVFRGVANRLAGKGYVAVIPHIFERTNHVVGAPFKEGEYQTLIDGVADAVDFVAKRNDVDPERIGFIGYSMGAYMAFNRSARDPRIKAIVSLSGSLPLHSTAQFPPTLLLHGSKDKSTTAAQAKEFEAALKERDIPVASHIYMGMPHNFDPGRFADAGRRAGVFFDKYLMKAGRTKPNTKPKDASVEEPPAKSDDAIGEERPAKLKDGGRAKPPSDDDGT